MKSWKEYVSRVRNYIHSHKCVFITLFIILCLFLLSFSSDTIFKNGSTFYSKYSAHVDIRIEKSLSVENATLLTLMALESINETFGYHMTLNEVTTFEDDHKENYSRPYRFIPYEIAKLRLKSLIQKHISVTMTFYKGNGPDTKTSSGISNASGASDRADSIWLYFDNTNDMFSMSSESWANHTMRNIRTILHEFGHSFCLNENPKSGIMYTAEKKYNPTGSNNLIFNVTVNFGLVTIPNEIDENTTVQDIYTSLICTVFPYQIAYNWSYNPHIVNDTTSSGYTQTHVYYILNEQAHETILIYLWESYTVNLGDIDRHYSATYRIIDFDDFTDCWLPEELARC